MAIVATTAAGCQAGPFGKMQTFRQSFQQPGYANLIHHFCQLSTAGRPQPLHRARIRGHDRFYSLERCLVATHHHRQNALFSAGLTAGDGGVQENQMAFAGARRQLPGELRRGGRMIYKRGAVPGIA